MPRVAVWAAVTLPIGAMQAGTSGPTRCPMRGGYAEKSLATSGRPADAGFRTSPEARAGQIVGRRFPPTTHPRPALLSASSISLFLAR